MSQCPMFVIGNERKRLVHSVFFVGKLVPRKLLYYISYFKDKNNNNSSSPPTYIDVYMYIFQEGSKYVIKCGCFVQVGETFLKCILNEQLRTTVILLREISLSICTEIMPTLLSRASVCFCFVVVVMILFNANVKVMLNVCVLQKV